MTDAVPTSIASPRGEVTGKILAEIANKGNSANLEGSPGQK